MCKKYYRIKYEDGWYYAQYRVWWSPIYIIIDCNRTQDTAMMYINNNKANRVVYKECV